MPTLAVTLNREGKSSVRSQKEDLGLGADISGVFEEIEESVNENFDNLVDSPGKFTVNIFGETYILYQEDFDIKIYSEPDGYLVFNRKAKI